jgi:hypothetical protein
MAWLRFRLASIELKHPHCQTRWRRRIVLLAAVFSRAQAEVPQAVE